MTDKHVTPMTEPERERLIELVMDWVHAMWLIVAQPVLLGVLLAGWLGWWPGFAGFVCGAVYGALTVHHRHLEDSDG